MKIVDYSIDTIGDNTLKGTVANHALKAKIPLEEAIKSHHVFFYRDYNQNMPIERLVDDVAWLYAHGALSVRLKKLPQ